MAIYKWTRPDGYNGPVRLRAYALMDGYHFKERLHTYPIRSTDNRSLHGRFDQTDDVKPMTLEAAAAEISYALGAISASSIEGLVQSQLSHWDQALANALCSLCIPLLGYDNFEGADGDSWKEVFGSYFPQFDIEELGAVKAAICAGDVGVEVWHSDGPGTSYMSWVVSLYHGGSPLFSRKGQWVARPDYKLGDTQTHRLKCHLNSVGVKWSSSSRGLYMSWQEFKEAAFLLSEEGRCFLSPCGVRVASVKMSGEGLSLEVYI